MESKYSVVEFFHEGSGDSCGYCKSSNTNINTGMWAHTMTVEDYQDLIDRGWRRSGQYCYKPSLTVTCCPLYTIKCDALNLKLSKSQKKLLKRVSKFLNEGQSSKSFGNNDTESDSGADMNHEENSIFSKEVAQLLEEKSKTEVPEIHEVHHEAEEPSKSSGESPESRLSSSQDKLSYEAEASDKCKSSDIETPEKRNLKVPRPGVGLDASRPLCKKAKLLRIEKKKKKLSEKNISLDDASNKPGSIDKSLEDFIHQSDKETPLNKLEIRLVPVPCDKDLLRESWELFVTYQTTIHKESEEECDFRTFYSFLVSSPLQSKNPTNSPSTGYGSFHQQYWLNNKLIAVGVIDILPKCVSSVYFFYDPDYSFLSLGTYGSLRELEFVRSLHNEVPEISSYYMGYYIHSCPKMRYKARFSPSHLLCPEVYTWHPILDCQLKLDKSKYARFNDDLDAVCEDSFINLNKVLVLWKQIAMPYSSYKMRAKDAGLSEDEEVTRFAQLVGRKCSERMLLYRS